MLRKKENETKINEKGYVRQWKKLRNMVNTLDQELEKQNT